MPNHRPAIFDDPTLRMFGDTASRFFDTHAPPSALDQWRRDGVVARSLWDEAVKAGLLGISIPEQYGGAGLDFRFEATMIEETSRRGLDGFGAGLHNVIVAPYIVSSGTEEQKQRWLPRMVSGELLGAIAMTEPGTGSDLRAIRTSARRDGGDYLINGQKTYISSGQTANLIATVARLEGAEAGRDICVFFVEADDCEGFTRGRNLEKVGLEAADTSELFFDNVRVPAANLLGEQEGQGMAQLMANLPQERLMIALGGVVAAERALEETVAFVKDRKAFGKPVIEFQHSQFKLAECKTEATIARIFIDHCIALHVGGELDATTAAMAKYWVTDMQCRVIDECVQLHGGAGYMLEYPIARMYRDARAQRIYGGTNEIMKLLIARTL